MRLEIALALRLRLWRSDDGGPDARPEVVSKRYPKPSTLKPFRLEKNHGEGIFRSRVKNFKNA